jgi:ATP-binding cassette, subfamily F, member 3
MALVTGTNLARSFGADDIFGGVSVSIPHGARIALVGPNGAGKTTLLRLLARLDEPTGGTVTHARHLRIGFLPQEAELTLSGQGTLWDEMLAVFAGLIAQEARLSALADTLASHPENADLLAQYGDAQHTFEQAGGYEYPIRIKQVLAGLGFDETDIERPLGQLSGGQKTRALLARLLLEDPDLLILDEPTNHLDIRAVEWLEGWLKGFPGALLIVSHDRYFMDSLVGHVWELIFGQLEEYRGNYSAYVNQREERHTRLLKEYERQQEFVEKEQDYIRRNIAGQNTRQAQGRRKRLERYLRDEAIARPREQRSISIRLDARRRSGDKVLMTRDLVVGYHDDGVPLFEVPDITLYRGECAALIGPNGAGKTTFLKTILEQLEPLSGEVKLGASVEIGYFAQAHEQLDPERNVIDEILSVKNLPISEARDYLGRFLFSGDDIYKPVTALSGGERGRVALAKLALSGANLLLLDEPTNHLDIPSQEILEAVLADYEGTILLVSHDRYLIRSLATQIWALHAEPGKARHPGSSRDASHRHELHAPHRPSGGKAELVVFEGPYGEYVTWREGRAAPGAGRDKPARKPAAQPARPAEGSRAPDLSSYERRKRLQEVEQRIERAEVELVNLSGALETASSAGNVAEVARLGEAYRLAEAELDGLMSEWEMLVADV